MPKSHAPTDSTNTVRLEDRWISILQDSIGESTARELTMTIFADPRLTISDPEQSDKRDIIEDVLQSLIEQGDVDTGVLEQHEAELLQTVNYSGA